MARKFKVGDKVKVVRQYGQFEVPLKSMLNKKGKVISIFAEKGHRYPYEVRLKGSGLIVNFNARELEKIK